MESFILMAIALIPAIVLCVYVFVKDKVEKEPVALLLSLFFLGALSCFIAAPVESFLSGILDSVYPADVVREVLTNSVRIYKAETVLYIGIYMFFCVALVEEGCKFIILNVVTRKHEEYNSLFDGLIYAVFVSLGFAALENVLYVFNYGIQVGISRAILSVPGHMFFAVMMGYNYSLGHIKDKAARLEMELIEDGVIQRGKEGFCSRKEKVLSLVIPVLAHGFYNSCCMIGTPLAVIILYAFVIFMYVHCFRKIRFMSNADAYETSYVRAILEDRYPELENKEEELSEISIDTAETNVVE